MFILLFPLTLYVDGCKDNNDACDGWAKRGECEINPRYMLKNCQLSCGTCEGKSCHQLHRKITIFRVPLLPSSYEVPPSVTTRLLDSGGRSNSHIGTVNVLCNGVHITKLQHDNHVKWAPKGATFSGTTKLLSRYTSSWWYPMGSSS